MKYEEFKEDMLIAIDFDQLTMEEVEEFIQEWYVQFKECNCYANVAEFCKDQVPVSRDTGSLWISERGMEILRLREILFSMQ